MNSGVQIIAVVAAVIAAAIWIGAVQRRRQKAAFRKRLLKQFGKIPDKKMSSERYARVPAYYLRHLPEDGIDEITWNDLDMDAVYRRMDSTQSSPGEEYLYALLRSPIPGKGSSELPDLSGSVSAFPVSLPVIRALEDPANRDLRLSLQLALHRFGHMSRYSLYEYLDKLKEVRPDSNWKHAPAFLLPAASILVLLWNVPAGIVCLILSMIFNMASYYHFKGRADPYIQTCVYLLRMMRCADELADAGLEKVMAAEGTRLSEIQKGFQKIRRGSGILISGSASSGGNPVDLVLDYIRILFHLDLIKFNSMLAGIQRQQKEIDEELTIIGRVDTAIALASFEKSLPYTCEPDLEDSSEAFLSLQEVYHPLVANPVPNSIRTEKSVLLTGSNASGKSTFLKSVALCALFAQTIGFCPAKHYRAPRFRIRSSMALRDNILNGESYFMVEIRSLKRIADLADDGSLPVLCFIDEVLRGTNTIERIAASSEILEALAQKGVLCFAATHDVELTELLRGSFDNYHFGEELGEEDVVFSYRLQDGPATTRNAIRLLSRVGFSPEITDKAEERARRFEQTGEWI